MWNKPEHSLNSSDDEESLTVLSSTGGGAGRGKAISLRERAMRYLARREHSRVELQHKLQPHVQEGENLDAILDELEKRNWLSDARAATLFVDTKRGRFGTQRITHELRQKGIPENLIAEALPQLKESELDAAREVWQRKFGVQPQDAKEKAKQMRFMQSRGFSMEVIFKVLRHDSQLD